VTALPLGAGRDAPSNLQAAVMRYVTVLGADLTNATLDQADVRGADFTGAKLQGASLRGADMTLAAGVVIGQAA